MKQIGTKYKYAVRKSLIELDDGSKKEIFVIPLVDTETGLWVKLTDYADLMLYKCDEDASAFKADKSSLHFVCAFLNYLFDNELVSTPLEITKEMAQDYLDYYSQTYDKRGRYPAKATVKRVRDAITVFLEMLAFNRGEKMLHIRYGDLSSSHYVINSDHKSIPRPVYTLKIHPIHNGTGGLQQLERDMPLGIVSRLEEMARIHDPEIEFAIVLMAFMGLREGSVCNVRRKSSAYGPGIIDTVQKIECAGGIERKCLGFMVDLKREYLMRSDKVDVGNIKREREQIAFASFKDHIYEAYERHLSLIASKPCEASMPMFLLKKKSKNGKYMALTAKELRKRIMDIMYKYVLPSCKDDPDIDMQIFYHQMTVNKKTWGPHALRHWFTVMLVLYGCDQPTIMTMRGDSSPLSAMMYLERKAVFQKMYEKSLDKMMLKYTGGINDVET